MDDIETESLTHCFQKISSVSSYDALGSTACAYHHGGNLQMLYISVLLLILYYGRHLKHQTLDFIECKNI